MKKLMSLGCLMALVLAGAPAFAADWFTTSISPAPQGGVGPVLDGTRGSWTIADLTLTEVWEDDSFEGISFNDWNRELVFSANEAKLASNSNSIIKTTVKFTALDGSEGEEFPSEMTSALAGAKAGLTIVDAGESKSFYGIVLGDNGPEWIPLSGDADEACNNPVEVKIEIMAGEGGASIQYSVGGVPLADNYNKDVFKAANTEDFSVQSVSYKGNVPLLSSLVGYAYGNTGTAQEEVEVEETETIPAKIVYDPLVLAARNVDVTDANAVKTYLTSTQSNGNLGWVNSTLGIADDQFVEIASNTCEQGSVTVDFGFAQDGKSTIKYVIDTANTNENAQIDTAQSGIHTVAVQVTQGGKTVTVTNQQVGVMSTGKTLTEEEKAAKGDKKIFDIVAVPFESFQGQVTVANVLNTAELEDGDTLYVLNKTANKYDTYVLDEGVWTVYGDGHAYGRNQATSNETPDPDKAVLTPGQAVWIERNVNSKIVFAGKGEVTVNHTWEWKSEYGEYSLVANPTINAFNLQGQTFGVNGDQIIVEDVDNPRKFEKKNDVWGQWVTVKKTIRGKDYTTLSFKTAPEATLDFNMVIDAGIGFWYYNPTQAAVEIDFGTNAKSEPTVD